MGEILEFVHVHVHQNVHDHDERSLRLAVDVDMDVDVDVDEKITRAATRQALQRPFEQMLDLRAGEFLYDRAAVRAVGGEVDGVHLL